MNELIMSHFQRLEEHKDGVLKLLKGKSRQEIEWSEEGQWSMIQAMRHVQMSEEMSIGYLKKKSLAGDQMKTRPMMARIYLLMLFMVFRLRLKFKAPKALSQPRLSTVDELEADWDKTRKELLNFLNDYPVKWRYKAVYKHPVVGMLNITDAMKFLNVHLLHHINQVHRIERLLRKSDAFDNR